MDLRDWVEAVGRAFDQIKDGDEWKAERAYQAAVDHAMRTPRRWLTPAAEQSEAE